MSGGKSPTARSPPAEDRTQRSARRPDSTHARTVSRIDATVRIIASVIPRAIASAVTAMELRA